MIILLINRQHEWQGGGRGQSEAHAGKGQAAGEDCGEVQAGDGVCLLEDRRPGLALVFGRDKDRRNRQAVEGAEGSVSDGPARRHLRLFRPQLSQAALLRVRVPHLQRGQRAPHQRQRHFPQRTRARRLRQSARTARPLREVQARGADPARRGTRGKRGADPQVHREVRGREGAGDDGGVRHLQKGAEGGGAQRNPREQLLREGRRGADGQLGAAAAAGLGLAGKPLQALLEEQGERSARMPIVAVGVASQGVHPRSLKHASAQAAEGAGGQALRPMIFTASNKNQAFSSVTAQQGRLWAMTDSMKARYMGERHRTTDLSKPLIFHLALQLMREQPMNTATSRVKLRRVRARPARKRASWKARKVLRQSSRSLVQQSMLLASARRLGMVSRQVTISMRVMPGILGRLERMMGMRLVQAMAMEATLTSRMASVVKCESAPTPFSWLKMKRLTTVMMVSGTKILIMSMTMYLQMGTSMITLSQASMLKPTCLPRCSSQNCSKARGRAWARGGCRRQRQSLRPRLQRGSQLAKLLFLRMFLKCGWRTRLLSAMMYSPLSVQQWRLILKQRLTCCGEAWSEVVRSLKGAKGLQKGSSGWLSWVSTQVKCSFTSCPSCSTFSVEMVITILRRLRLKGAKKPPQVLSISALKRFKMRQLSVLCCLLCATSMSHVLSWMLHSESSDPLSSSSCSGRNSVMSLLKLRPSSSFRPSLRQLWKTCQRSELQRICRCRQPLMTALLFSRLMSPKFLMSKQTSVGRQYSTFRFVSRRVQRARLLQFWARSWPRSLGTLLRLAKTSVSSRTFSTPPTRLQGRKQPLNSPRKELSYIDTLSRSLSWNCSLPLVRNCIFWMLPQKQTNPLSACQSNMPSNTPTSDTSAICWIFEFSQNFPLSYPWAKKGEGSAALKVALTTSLLLQTRQMGTSSLRQSRGGGEAGLTLAAVAWRLSYQREEKLLASSQLMLRMSLGCTESKRRY